MLRLRALGRTAVVALVVGGGLWSGPPAVAQTAAGPGAARSEGVSLVGFTDLGGAGLNGDLAVVGDTVLVAAGITPDTIPNQGFYGFTVTYPCPAVSVKVVDLSEPSRPTVVATIPVPAGVAAVDVDAARVRSPTFTGDLAAVALANCGGPGGNTDRGVAYYDVTKPAQPEFLGRYFADFEFVQPADPPCGAPGGNGRRCAQSERSVALVQRADGRVLSLSTQPFASGSAFLSGNAGAPGDMRVVDVTDPRNPTQVSSFPNISTVAIGGSASGRPGFSKNGCRPIETGRGVAFGQGGQLALLANQDLGMYSVDIANPANPGLLGHAAIYDRNDRTVEGTAGYVTEAVLGDRRLALLADEDWIAPTTRVRIDAPSSLAGSKFACEAMFTLFDEDDQAQVYRKPGAQISGEFVYIGRGCPPSTANPGGDPLLADPAGKIAVMDHTRDPVTQPNITPPAGIGCGYDVKTRRAQEAGAVAVVMRRQGAVPEALSESGGSAGLTIPMVQVDTADGDALRATLCPGVDPAGACAGGNRVTGAVADTAGQWGALNVIDNTDPVAPRLVATYRTPTAGVFPPPDLGVYSVRHAVSAGNRALVAAYSDGLRVLDLSDPSSVTEVASFVPRDTTDPTNTIPDKALVVGVGAVGPNIVVSDVHSGLYVLNLTGRGYRTVAADGGLFAFGGADFLGSAGSARLNRPIVGTASTPSGKGYWMVASDGGVFAFGDARFFGSTGALRLNSPIVGMAPTPTGRGYWLVAADGGVFAFGDARFAGSTGATRLNRPMVAMAATPSGRGYWLVASDGGVFAFGDARFSGGTGGVRLNSPVVGAAATPTGDGYWLVAADGGVFAFGDARFAGSTGGTRLNRPIVGLAPAPSGRGYWLAASDGGVFAFGDARFLGSTGALQLNSPVVGIAASP